MGPEIVHPVPIDELPGWTRAMTSTFLADPEGEETEKRATNLARSAGRDHHWGARDGDRWVATLRTFERTLTVPGAGGTTELITADGVTSVTVAATHRRRGLLTRMLTDALRQARERGNAVSILIAAEWPIYGRYGYAPAALAARHVLHRSRPGAVITGEVARVRQVDRAQFAQVAPAVFDAARRRRAGNVDRDPPWWERTFGLDGWEPYPDLPHNYLVHDGETGVDGLLAWTATRDAVGLLPPLGAVRADGPHAASDTAYRDLWAYLSGLDLIDEIASHGPIDEPVRWLLPDARTLVTTELVDELWLRLLDVPAALSARRYAVDGELVLEVVDDTEVSVAGRYRLAAAGERVECELTRDPPDLTLVQTALASAYLGGFALRGQALAGTVHEHTAGALDRADAMFATALAPYNATGF